LYVYLLLYRPSYGTGQRPVMLSAAGKVTVGLASHWPCITDSVVYPPTGSTANVWEMSTSPTRHWGTAPLPLPSYGLMSEINVD